MTVDLTASVVDRSATSLTIAYAVDNRSDDAIVVCNRLHRQAADGRYDIDPDLVYVTFEPGPAPNVGKWIPDRGDDVNVEVPVQPFATILAPGARTEERVTIALPVRPCDPYRPAPVRDATLAEPSTGLSFSIGWISRSELDDVLVPDVDTSIGRVPIVKASPSVQRLARVDLGVSVPSLPPSLVRVDAWVCASCGTANRGEQDRCLRCSTPRPTWSPTHVVGASGADAYDQPGGTVSSRLGAGLPVAVTEQTGGWSRVVASNGWSGWVDTRLLDAGPRS